MVTLLRPKMGSVVLPIGKSTTAPTTDHLWILSPSTMWKFLLVLSIFLHSCNGSGASGAYTGSGSGSSSSRGVSDSGAKNANTDLTFDDLIDIDQSKDVQLTTNNIAPHSKDLLDRNDLIEDQLQLVQDIGEESDDDSADTDASITSDNWLVKSVKRVRRELSRLLGVGKLKATEQEGRTKLAKKSAKKGAHKHRRRSSNDHNQQQQQQQQQQLESPSKQNVGRKLKKMPGILRSSRQTNNDYGEEYEDTDASGDFPVDNDNEPQSVEYYRTLFTVHEVWNENYRSGKHSTEFMELHRYLETAFRDFYNSVAGDDEENAFRATLLNVGPTSDPFKIHVIVLLEIPAKITNFGTIFEDHLREFSRIGEQFGAEIDHDFYFRQISESEINDIPEMDYTILDKATTSIPHEPDFNVTHDNENDNVGGDVDEDEHESTSQTYQTDRDWVTEAHVDPHNFCENNPNGQFKCASGEEIPCDQRCDHFPDCTDAFDELNCTYDSMEESEAEAERERQEANERERQKQIEQERQQQFEREHQKKLAEEERKRKEFEEQERKRQEFEEEERKRQELEEEEQRKREDFEEEERQRKKLEDEEHRRQELEVQEEERKHREYEKAAKEEEEEEARRRQETQRRNEGDDHFDDNTIYEENVEGSGETYDEIGGGASGSTTTSPLYGRPTAGTQCRGDDAYVCVYSRVQICEVQRCDGRADCPDGEDEQDCEDDRRGDGGNGYDQKHIDECSSNEFKCDENRCLPLEYKCNGVPDCFDSSDEQGCDRHKECHSNEFQCRSGHCIDGSKRCDRHQDCPDGDDEDQYCPASHQTADDCGMDEFFCDDDCHSNAMRCDGHVDCLDSIDEMNCPPDQNNWNQYNVTRRPTYPCPQLTCPNGKCYTRAEKCDGTPDCEDATDEINCCAPYQFACHSGECVPDTARCNRVSDCSDDSDEEDCRDSVEYPQRGACRPYQFRCDNGQCVSEYAKCDGRTDCVDASDERNCLNQPPPATPQLNLKTYPDSQIIKESREVIFRCRDEGPLRSKVKWSRPGGRPLPAGFTDKNGRLEIPNIRVEDSGKYICEAVGYPAHVPGQHVTVHLTVERYNPIYDRPPTACHSNQATCMNGECIDKGQICDGIPHCSDGSDEHSCSRGRKCQPNQFMCRNGRCVDRIWRCDGENDCYDNSDEESCDAEPSGAPCRYDEFQCRSGHCIPKTFHCDDSNDCSDGSDEIGCMAPAVIRPPPPRVSLPNGAVLNITCVATGVPVPVIVWRLNWGHVPDKCESKSYGGVGSLYCPDMRTPDSGAYSCEIVNTKGTIFVTPDTLVTIDNPDVGVCPAGFFNILAQRREECINCFCFGATKQCTSADLFIYPLNPPITSHHVVNVEIQPYTDVIINEATGHEVINLHHGVQFRASDIAYTRQIPYLALPPDYNGNQLKSYGGFLNYNVQFVGSGRATQSPDVIITGNGYSLTHRSRSQPQVNANNKVTVQFSPGNWYKPDGRVATREEIMMILANVDNILIRLGYVDSTEREVELTNISMDSAGIHDRGLGSASLVEHCSCPPGYTGDSCEGCAPGYVRQPGGPWLGRCIPHEPEPCSLGQYGDPRRGIPCKPCPCPLTNPTNNFATSCTLSPDGEVVCNCQTGYTGRRCEYCAPGYEGNPLHPGGSCYPGPSNECNPEGTYYSHRNGTCECKSHVVGARCDECAQNSFHLNSFTYSGCIECFCMGITKQCTSSSWYRDSVMSNFGRTRANHGFTLIRDYDSKTPTDVQFSERNSELHFGQQTPDILYWSLPPTFLGDKITSYGGNLNYTLSYSPLPGGHMSRNVAPDVVIKSANDLSILHYRKSEVNPSISQTYAIPIIESAWQRSDGITINREHLLMALADIQAIYIKATYTTVTKDGTLTHVSLDTATRSNTGNSRAVEVEECRCPPEYTGLSCEDCAPGYKRTFESGLYLGLCEPCECHGHSAQCDAETGICLDCGDNTVGDYCDECAPGFQGNATVGSPYDCQPGDSRNQTSCNFCSQAGTSNCNNNYCECKQNVEGPYCDHCRRGTYGLSESNIDGCAECFCSGVSNQCRSATLYRQLIPADFISKPPLLTDENGDIADRENLEFQIDTNTYTYSTTSYTQKYWSLRGPLLGDQLNSYGGFLSFSLAVETYGHYENGNDVILIGNGLKLVWSRPPGDQDVEDLKVQLHEDEDWLRVDRYSTGKASRSDIMTVLSGLEHILIRATPKIPTTKTSIGNVILESAVETNLVPGAGVASEIEVCSCPPGYTGRSCQSCAPLHYRDTADNTRSVFGSCVACPCTEDSTESCSLGSNGYVECHCRQGYIGDRCQNRADSTPVTTTQRPYEAEIVVSISQPEISIIPVGGSLTLVCSGRSLTNRKPVYVTWYKLDGRLPNESEQERGSLYLHNLQIYDSGVYICQAKHDANVFEDRVSITVSPQTQETPPEVILPSPYLNLVEYVPGEVDCVVRGSPLPTITWTRVGGQMSRDVRTEGTRLVFLSPRKSDEARYRCQATNPLGSNENFVQVYVRPGQPEQPPQPTLPSRDVIYIEPPSYSGVPGDNLQLACQQRTPIVLTYEWTKDGAPLHWQRHIVISGNNLVIRETSARDSGTYTCTGIDQRNRRNYTSTAYVTIAESRPPSPGGVAPVVKPLQEEHRIIQGQDFSITCEASGTPYPKIKWTKVHEALDANIQQTGNVLRIINAKPANRGMYVCIAESPAGSDQSNTIIDVEPRERPAIEIHPRAPQISIVGSQAMLYCRPSAGIPEPTLKWRRVDGQPLSPRAQEERPGDMLINNIQLADAGEYECVAENVAGKTSATLSVSVIEPPTISLAPDVEDMELTEGDELKIVCSASGTPPPNVEWVDENQQPQQPRTNFRGLPLPEAYLEIYRVTQNDAKVYQCVATNDAGTDSKFISVRVKPRRGDTGISDIDIPSRYPERQPPRQQPPTRQPEYQPYPTQPQPPPPGQSAKNIYRAEAGDTVTLSCDLNAPHVRKTTWERVDGRPLPANARLDSNSLIITRIEPDAGGSYRCNALDNRGTVVTYVIADLVLVPLPHITMHPEMPITVIPNETVDIYCEVTGEQPIEVAWHADNNRPLPKSVRADGQYLHFDAITPADAGRYYCSASNRYGNTTNVAEVVVNRGTSLEQQPQNRARVYDINEGDNVQLTCDVKRPNGEELRYTWSRQGGRPLPVNSHPNKQNLYLSSVRPEDQGRYICESYSANGVTSEPTYVDLNIKPVIPQQAKYPPPRRPHPSYGNRVYDNQPVLKLDQQHSTLRIGESTEVECYSSDDSYTFVVWERADGEPLPPHIKQTGNKLIITNADVSDAGNYVCKCKTDEGDLYTTSYELDIDETQHESKNPKTAHAKVGTPVTLHCDAEPSSDGQLPTYRWSRQYGQIQQGKDLHNEELHLADLQSRDAGTYICTATLSNGEAVDYPTILVVTGAIPQFQQAPRSYMSFPTLPNSYIKFSFEITFRPQQPNGLILYNGQKRGSGDYIALSLNDRYPEFRFDFDGKPMVIRSEAPVNINDWHTIRVNRFRRDGYMMVDNQHPIAFPAVAQVSPLDLVEDLYIGGVPRWEDLPTNAVEKAVGFVGCISRLTLQDQIVELNKDAKYKEGITSCEPCADEPCANDGTCLESQTEMGYTCICQEGFTGRNCAIKGTSCTPGICGSGRCENTELGMECFCPLNKTGDRCQYIEHLNENSLAFRRGSFAAYNTPRPSKMNIKFQVRPNSLEDSILMYTAESNLVSGDFVAVVVRDKHVELRINTGARLRPVIVKSLNPLPLNKWTEIEISRRLGEGILRVGNDPEQKAKASGLARTLHLKTPLYIGGYDRQLTLHRDVNITGGFDGCISNLLESSRKINLIADIKDAANVQNCGENNEIDSLAGSGYDDMDMDDMETCDRDPCENGGTCTINSKGIIECLCPLGFSGNHCEEHITIEFNANFRGNGYLELDRSQFSEEIEQKYSFAAMVFSTTDPNGLLFWWGQEKGQEYIGQDFIALAIVDGIVEYSLRLNNEETVIRNPAKKVDDGRRHIVIIKRTNNTAILELDHILDAGETRPTIKKTMSLPGNVFIGGAPDIAKFTGNRFTSGFNGCVRVVEAESSGQIPLGDVAISAVNVDTCPYEDATLEGTEPPVV